MLNEFNKTINEFEINISTETNKIINWIKKIFKDSGAKGAVLGMSGGIDCSVVARLLQKAEIPTILIMMPYGHSMKLAGDNEDSLALIDKFNFEYMIVDISTTVDTLVNSIAINSNTENQITHTLIGTAEQIKGRKIPLIQMSIDNIKPRVRMTTLYTLAQSLGYLVVGTGNLSELTMGYFTKWGDGASDMNPIAQLTKTQIKILGKYLELPERIITKAPSANLWDGQTDEDEMGVKYNKLDEYILTGTVENDIKSKEVIETAYNRSKHKRNSIITIK